MKFRISGTPMPNPENYRNQIKLKTKLEKARKIRTNQTESTAKKSTIKMKSSASSKVHTLGSI
jgi:hypothetical protein